MKTGILFLAAAVVVLAAAGGAYVYLLGDEPIAAPAATEKAAAPAAPAADAADMARLKQENALLKEQLDNLRVELNAKEREQAAALQRQQARAAQAEDEGEGGPSDDVPLPDDGTERERRNRPGGWSEERAAEFRAGIDQFYADAIAASTSPESQERLVLMQDYTNQMMDLRQQMRAAEDPDARQALQDEFNAARDDMRALTREQQNQMLREAAASSGVTDPKKQAQLIESLRETIKSPFFMQDRGFGRGGGGFGGGGQDSAAVKPKKAGKARN